ncbi:hypothetical protein BGZ63DRAFT_371246 [Mariannaea sp. PMI_226]|nr:hypothetical protein BGZ63DRAFT_371246 [Mariannaea sp. PMI_226]
MLSFPLPRQQPSRLPESAGRTATPVLHLLRDYPRALPYFLHPPCLLRVSHAHWTAGGRLAPGPPGLVKAKLAFYFILVRRDSSMCCN